MIPTTLIRIAVATMALCALTPLAPPAAASDPCVTTPSGATACGSVTADAITGTCTATGTATASVTWDFSCSTDTHTSQDSATGLAYGPKRLTTFGPCPVVARLYADGVLVDSLGAC